MGEREASRAREGVRLLAVRRLADQGAGTDATATYRARGSPYAIGFRQSRQSKEVG